LPIPDNFYCHYLQKNEVAEGNKITGQRVGRHEHTHKQKQETVNDAPTAGILFAVDKN